MSHTKPNVPSFDEINAMIAGSPGRHFMLKGKSVQRAILQLKADLASTRRAGLRDCAPDPFADEGGWD